MGRKKIKIERITDERVRKVPLLISVHAEKVWNLHFVRGKRLLHVASTRLAIATDSHGRCSLPTT